jgi:hypothetical protein
MVSGKFHNKVPLQIINEYKIVERLLCYSYYHYPLLDEAFSKVTRIFESAINLRLDELGLPKAKRIESLEMKIKRIEPFTSQDVLKVWNKARKIRNAFAHPEAGKLMGIIVLKRFYQMVNIINTIFIEKEKIEENDHLLNGLKIKSQYLKEGLFKLQINDSNYLIWSIIPYSFYRTKTLDKSFWVFYPVLTHFPKTSDKLDYSPPICLKLSNIEFKKDGLEALLLNTEKGIKVITTDNPINVSKYMRYKELIDSSELVVRSMYLQSLETEITFEIEKFLYNDCWE